jgi:thiol-disulfide isomerase/thioredoxin
MSRFRITDKDWRFLIWTVVAALLILGLMHQYKPKLAPQTAVTAEELRDIRQQIQPVWPAQVAPMLADSQGRRTLLYIYASWCGYCKQMMPGLLQVLDQPEFAGYQRRFLSLDQHPRQLATYLASARMGGQFIPYQLEPGTSADFQNMLRGRGGEFTGSIPYMALFDARGSLIAQYKGGLSPRALPNFLRAPEMP